MALSVHDLELAQHLGVEPALGPLTPTLTTYWWANCGALTSALSVSGKRMPTKVPFGLRTIVPSSCRTTHARAMFVTCSSSPPTDEQNLSGWWLVVNGASVNVLQS